MAPTAAVLARSTGVLAHTGALECAEYRFCLTEVRSLRGRVESLH